MSMREKIAEALFLQDYPKDHWQRLDAGHGSHNQDRYRKKADAVLDALMEPTIGMQNAALPLVGRMHQTRDIFSAMIRAAKEGK